MAGLLAGGAARLLLPWAEMRQRNSGVRTAAGTIEPAAATVPDHRPAAPALDDVLAARGAVRLRKAVAYLLDADAEALVTLAARCLAERLPEDDPLWTLLMARWAGVDPQSMFVWVRSVRDDDRGVLLHAAWSAWTVESPAAARAAARKEKKSIRSAVLNVLAGADPDAALAFARRLPEGEAALQDSGALDALAAHWPDLEQRLTHPALKHAARVAAVKALALTDPRRALTEAAQIPLSLVYDMPVADIMKQFAAADPAGAAAAWESLPRTQATAGAAIHLVKAWAPQDAAAALEWSRKSLPGSLHGQAIMEIAAAQGATDPAGALRLLAEEKGSLRSSRDDASPFGLTIRDTGESHEYSASGNIGQEELLRDLARRIPANQLLEAVKSLLAPELDRSRRHALLTGILTGAAEIEAGPALSVLRAGVLAPEEKQQMASAVIQTIAKEDPAAAAAALTGLPTDAETYDQLAMHWMEQDEAAASAWVRDLRPGLNRDLAAYRLVSGLLGAKAPDYDAAFAWVDEIESESHHRLSTESIWRTWLQKDEPAAREAMRDAGLTREQMEKQIAALKEGGGQ